MGGNAEPGNGPHEGLSAAYLGEEGLGSLSAAHPGPCCWGTLTSSTAQSPVTFSEASPTPPATFPHPSRGSYVLQPEDPSTLRFQLHTEPGGANLSRTCCSLGAPGASGLRAEEGRGGRGWSRLPSALPLPPQAARAPQPDETNSTADTPGPPEHPRQQLGPAVGQGSGPRPRVRSDRRTEPGGQGGRWGHGHPNSGDPRSGPGQAKAERPLLGRILLKITPF